MASRAGLSVNDVNIGRPQSDDSVKPCSHACTRDELLKAGKQT